MSAMKGLKDKDIKGWDGEEEDEQNDEIGYRIDAINILLASSLGICIQLHPKSSNSGWRGRRLVSTTSRECRRRRKTHLV